MYIDKNLAENLDVAKLRVTEKNWDYVPIVAGYPGSGKSTLAKGTIAPYCCPWFDKSYIAFSDEDFIKITNSAPEYSAVVLDESFASLNSRVTMTSAFLRIINHLQILRQKHLFIILCLPNFFDLSKGIAIFRASHLFVTYASKEGDRGRFLAFGRDTKRRLYVKGCKFMNYNAVKSDFIGRFTKNKNIISEEKYDKLKLKHLLAQQKEFEDKSHIKSDRDNLLYALRWKERFNVTKLAKISGLKERRVYQITEKQD